MALNQYNITKEIVKDIKPAPLPNVGTLLEARMGKVSTLAQEKSGIFKKKLRGRVFVGETGITGDEHVYPIHGGIDRALHQYASSHYADWRCEDAPKPELFQYGGFGENIVGTNMNEENVCVGDIYRIGDEVMVQVSEPRSPCYKLTLRFEWSRALKRTQRTGRVGWNMRVLKTGYIEKGDSIVLVDRPNPIWSIMNIKRIIQAKEVPLPRIAELAGLEVLTDMIKGYAQQRLEKTPKTYELVDTKMMTPRVKQLTFALRENITIKRTRFEDFSFAQIEFGRPSSIIKRSYSIVSGGMDKFSLGVALDDHSRGGSAYLHKDLKLGDKIQMSVGGSPKAVEDEQKCVEEDCVDQRVIIIGGIGVTAFLPITTKWEAEGTPYEVHYACRSPDQAAYLSHFPANKTTVYAKSEGKRLSVEELIPELPANGGCKRKIYCCGPSALMDACEERAKDLKYPEHMLHFESFGSDAGGNLGDPFEAEVHDLDSGKSANLKVPADKTLLRALIDAGFDMTYYCEAGGCGACKVTICGGKINHKGTALYESQKEKEMLACVSRGVGKIKIELD